MKKWIKKWPKMRFSSKKFLRISFVRESKNRINKNINGLVVNSIL